jgi:hypothetical protein
VVILRHKKLNKLKKLKIKYKMSKILVYKDVENKKPTQGMLEIQGWTTTAAGFMEKSSRSFSNYVAQKRAKVLLH